MLKGEIKMPKSLNNKQINQIFKQNFQNKENIVKEKMNFNFLETQPLLNPNNNIDFKKIIISKSITLKKKHKQILFSFHVSC